MKKLKIDVAKITQVKPGGIGHRCCIDLIGKFKKGEGMLVGMVCNGLFLVHSEIFKTKFGCEAVIRQKIRQSRDTCCFV